MTPGFRLADAARSPSFSGAASCVTMVPAISRGSSDVKRFVDLTVK
jgi:hypothetical protein